MKKSARLFYCAHCQSQVVICSDCDRGQSYCSNSCSQTARRMACRAADLRYQKTHQGKLKHASRQRKYRQRQQQKKEIVTEQGSPENSVHDVLHVEPTEVEISQSEPVIEKQLCHFCKKPTSEFLRRNFLDPDRDNVFVTKRFRANIL